MPKIINDLQRARKVYGSIYRTPVRVSLQTTVESDAAVLKLDWKESVRCASTADIPLPASPVIQTIDGVALVDGNRILLKDQTISSEKGIYVVNVAGGTWDRAPDAIPADTLTCGATVYVEDGTTNEYTKWILETKNVTLGGTQNWVPFGVATPAPPGNSIQYNNGGAFGGSANFTYDTNTVYLSGSFSQGSNNIASGLRSHAEGEDTTSSGPSSHAEGSTTTAAGEYSHAEGYNTTAAAETSHAEGFSTTTSGYASHAEGDSTTSWGDYSHAEGQETIASGSHQHASGKFNLRNNDFSLFVIGNGTGDADVDRSDVLRVNSGSIGDGRVEVTGSLAATMGLSGSLTQLVDGTSYLIAGANVSITSASNGAVTINAFNDTFTTTFGDGDLVSGIFTANHNLNFQYATVIVYDNTNKQVIPDEVNAATANATDIDLSTFAPIPGTWTTTIIGGYNKTYTQQFVFGDLVAGVLNVTHGLNSQYVIASVYDENDNQIIPDDVTATSSTTLDVDLNTFGSFPGTWKITVKA